MTIFYIVLAALVSELTFLIGYMLIYAIVRLLHFPYSLMHIKNRYRWMSDGILGGSLAIFLTCYVSFFITKNQVHSEFLKILIAIILPLIGEIGYYRYLSKKIKPFFLGRFHLIAKDPLERGEFAVNLHSITEQMVRENKIDKLTKDEAVINQIRKKAYDSTQGSLAYIFIWSFFGYVIGIILVHYFLF